MHRNATNRHPLKQFVRVESYTFAGRGDIRVEPDIHDEDLMKRFVLGDVSDAERERVEQAFQENSEYFDELCALEDELILLHLRDELPEVWTTRFRKVLEESPALARHVEETRALLLAATAERAAQVVETRSPAGLVEVPPVAGDRAQPPATPAPKEARRAWWGWSPGEFGFGLAAAAALVAAVVGWSLLRTPQSGVEPAGTAADAQFRTVPTAVATLLLVPGLNRGDLQQQNVFRVPAGTTGVELRLVVPGGHVAGMQAQLRPVGGTPLAIATEPTGTETPEGFEIRWSIPAGMMPPGDYLLSITSAVQGREPESVASRFFSIVE